MAVARRIRLGARTGYGFLHLPRACLDRTLQRAELRRDPLPIREGGTEGLFGRARRLGDARWKLPNGGVPRLLGGVESRPYRPNTLLRDAVHRGRLSRRAPRLLRLLRRLLAASPEGGARILAQPVELSAQTLEGHVAEGRMAGLGTGESRGQRVFRAGESRDVPANDIQGPVHFFEARIQLPRLRHPRFEHIQIRRAGRGEVRRHLTRPAGLQPADSVLRLTAPPSDTNGGEVGYADFDITVRFDLERLRDDSRIVVGPVLADVEVEGGTRGHGHDEADIQRPAGTRQVRRECSHRR